MSNALILPGDLFGDCVNVASKLGEDTCEAGEVMVDRKTFASIPAVDVEALQDAGFTTIPRTVEISSVTIEAEVIQPTSATAIPDFLNAAGMTIPHVSSLRGGHRDPLEMMVERSNVSDDNVARMALDREIDERLKIQGTVLNSDMSGFTRITKKFGILHFLAMILKMRSIVRPIIESCAGKILSYDGDNVIAVFSNPQDGVDGALKVFRALHEYNSKQDADTKLLLKIGLAHGVMYDTGKQLFGHTWETVELLGEELGNKRQLLVTSTVAKEVDLSAHSDIIESIKARPYPEGEKLAREGDTYTLIQTKTEVDAAAAAAADLLSEDREAPTACTRVHSEPPTLAEVPSLAVASVRNDHHPFNTAPARPHCPMGTEVDALLLQTHEEGANIDAIHARVRERYSKEGFALIVKLHTTEDVIEAELGGDGGAVLNPLAEGHTNKLGLHPPPRRRASTLDRKSVAARRRSQAQSTNTLR